MKGFFLTLRVASDPASRRMGAFPGGPFAVSFRSKRDPEADGRDDRSSEETDTDVDNPLFRTTERQRTATFGPAVTSPPSIEERTEPTVRQLDPTVPIASRRRSRTATLSALAIAALVGLALISAYWTLEGCR